MGKASCLSCHNPHASLQGKLLKTSAHDPVSEIQCDACHKPASSAKPFETSETGSKLCYNCHDVSKLKAGGGIEHNPFKEGECVACHLPHASEYTKLLPKEGNLLCFDCHKEKRERSSSIMLPSPVGKDAFPVILLMQPRTKTFLI